MIWCGLQYKGKNEQRWLHLREGGTQLVVYSVGWRYSRNNETDDNESKPLCRVTTASDNHTWLQKCCMRKKNNNKIACTVFLERTCNDEDELTHSKNSPYHLIIPQPRMLALHKPHFVLLRRIIHNLLIRWRLTEHLRNIPYYTNIRRLSWFSYKRTRMKSNSDIRRGETSIRFT